MKSFICCAMLLLLAVPAWAQDEDPLGKYFFPPELVILFFLSTRGPAVAHPLNLSGFSRQVMAISLVASASSRALCYVFMSSSRSIFLRLALVLRFL